MSTDNMQTDPNTNKHERPGDSWAGVLVAFALVFAGCAAQQRDATTGPISVSVMGKAETMEAVEDVLAEMHFAIEKADADSGLIRTRPLPGAQFFEFWRSDNVGSYNSLMANVHTIRRTVELEISENREQLHIDCEVRVQRLALPERDVSSSARVYGIFTRSSPSLQKLEFDPAQKEGMAWIDLDEDTRLAAEILKRIAKRLAPLASEPQVTESQT